MPRIPLDKLDCPNAFICWRGDVEQVALVRLVVEHEMDDDPDISHLQEDAENEHPELLEMFNAGRMHFIGIRARADISFPYGYTSNGPCTMEQPIHSGGLWGVEVIDGHDTADYIKEVENEELDSLKDMLQMLMVDLSQWDEKVKELDHKNGW